MKTIIIHNEAKINAKGNLSNGNCKPVICLDDGTRYTSVTDAAESVGVNPVTMCNHLKGKARKCKGKRYCYLNELTENANIIMDRLHEASTDAEDARRWREYQAEQEVIRRAEEERLAAIRRAEEEHQRQIAKARERVEKYTAKHNEYTIKCREAFDLKCEAERELEFLLGESEAVA